MVLRTLLIFCFVLLLTLSCQQDYVQPIKNRSYAEEVFDSINTHRILQSLSPFIWDSTIERYAFDHSYNMATGTIPFGHENFSERIDCLSAEIGGNGFAENVAMGYGTAESVVNGWLNSSGHKANIEGNYTHSALGIAYNSSGVPYYTQIFIHK